MLLNKNILNKNKMNKIAKEEEEKKETVLAGVCDSIWGARKELQPYPENSCFLQEGCHFSSTLILWVPEHLQIWLNHMKLTIPDHSDY